MKLNIGGNKPDAESNEVAEQPATKIGNAGAQPSETKKPIAIQPLQATSTTLAERLVKNKQQQEKL